PGEVAGDEEPGAPEPRPGRQLRPALAAAEGMGRQPVELKTRAARIVFPIDAHHALCGRGRANPRLLRQIGDVNEALAVVRVAVLTHIVAQPQAPPPPRPSLPPLHCEGIPRGRDTPEPGGASHGLSLPLPWCSERANRRRTPRPQR